LSQRATFGHQRHFRANIDVFGERCRSPHVALRGNLQLDVDKLGFFGDRRWVHGDFHPADTGNLHDVVGNFLRLSNGSSWDHDVPSGFVGSVVGEVADHLQARHLDAAEEYQEYEWQDHRHFDGNCTARGSRSVVLLHRCHLIQNKSRDAALGAFTC
jgi:hypothetical protein